MLQSPLALIRRLPPTVQVLIVGTFVNRAGSFIVPFLTLVLRREFHLDEHTVALLVAGYGAGSLCSILVGGVLTDRLGRRRSLLLSLSGSGVAAILLGMAPDISVFLPLLLCFGFLADLYRPASSAIVADLLPSSQRAIGFAALRMATNLGFAIGMTTGGLVADWSWRALFVGDGLTTCAFAAIVLAKVPETRPALAPGAEAVVGPSPWSDGLYLLLMSASVLFGITFFADFTILPLTVTMAAGYASVVYGALVGFNGLLIALFEVPITEAVSGFRRMRVAALGALLAALGFAINGLSLHWTGFLAGVVLWTLGEILAMPQMSSLVADWAPPASRGRYLSVYTATWSLGMAVHAPLLLPLYAALGDAAFWPVVGLLTLPAGAAFLYVDRVGDRPERLLGRTAG
ncbi:MAG: MFS transporter [Vicinamibacteria bacterium]|nr:MFS transporter [Vicinamibacteria bacterium]